MTKKRLLTAMALVLLIAGCNQPAAFPTAITTASPTVAATETPAPRLTLTPTPTATPQSTATPVLSEMNLRTWSSISPDGKWSAQWMVATPERGAGNYYTQLKVQRTDKTVEWTIVDEWSEWGLGYTIPQPLHWLRDGQYLYFTNRPVPDGCGIFVNGSDLHKVDLSNGSVTEVVSRSGLWLSLSPDDMTLAYIGYRGRGLVLHDLATGAERETKLDPGQDYAAGHIIWSLDGTSLVLTLAIQPCSTNWAASTSVVRIEVSSLEQTTLIHEDKRLFTTVEWATPDKVLLEDDAGDLWWMDSRTGLVTMQK